MVLRQQEYIPGCQRPLRPTPSCRFGLVQGADLRTPRNDPPYSPPYSPRIFFRESASPTRTSGVAGHWVVESGRDHAAVVVVEVGQAEAVDQGVDRVGAPLDLVLA